MGGHKTYIYTYEKYFERRNRSGIYSGGATSKTIAVSAVLAHNHAIRVYLQSVTQGLDPDSYRGWEMAACLLTKKYLP